MKARARLATVTVLLLVALSVAGEGGGDAGGSPSQMPPRELGVLAPVEAEVRVVVPKDGLWRAPESSFVWADGISVQPESGPSLVQREGEPRKGQFSYRADGALLFSTADVGRQVVVHYRFRPRRVVLLDAAPPADSADVPPLLRQLLAEGLGKHGFVVVPPQEVKEAAGLALDTISPPALPSPEKFATLAQQVSAAYVLIPGIGFGQQSRLDDVDTGIPMPRGKADRPSGPFAEEEPTLVLPILRSRLYGAARLTIVDGATGAVVGDVSVSDFQRVRLHRFAPARRSLVQRLAAQVVAAWREPTDGTAPR